MLVFVANIELPAMLQVKTHATAKATFMQVCLERTLPLFVNSSRRGLILKFLDLRRSQYNSYDFSFFTLPRCR